MRRGARRCRPSLVYLELPLRAGPASAAPLVYGRPDTWDGFWYIASAEQFRGSLSDPFGEPAGKLDDLVALAGRQLGPLALLDRRRRSSSTAIRRAARTRS